jgi:hypothetical protein
MRTFALMMLLLLGACSSSGDNTPGDEGEPCGTSTCAIGLVCCNASCGICTEPGGTCTDIVCEDPTAARCDAMDAAAEGDCETVLGYAFDGTDCQELVGCDCVGEDCEALYEAEVVCANDCVVSEAGDACGGETEATCSPGYFCAYDGDMTCTGEGTCELFSPGACAGMPNSVCGCDGVTYLSACAAYAAGTDVAYAGACETM